MSAVTLGTTLSSPTAAGGPMTFNPLNLSTFHWRRFRLGSDLVHTHVYVYEALCVCECVLAAAFMHANMG